MVEIPVEKKSTTPWWLWLLAAMLALALLVWLFADNNREPIRDAAVGEAVNETVTEPVVAQMPAVGTEPAALATDATAGPITSLATLTGAGDLTPMIGQQVRLTGVPVMAMAGDRTFFVGEGAERLFVLLPEKRQGLPSEASVDVNQGQTITLTGTLRGASDMIAGAAVEGLPSEAKAMLVADSVEIVSR